MNGQVVYADPVESPQTFARVVAALQRAAERDDCVGLDTEFYGLDITKQSCAFTARVHLLSVAVARTPSVILPRGARLSDAAVLTRRGIEHPDMVAWLKSGAKKACHNAGVDIHTLENEGIAVGGWINTLALARWTWPERARGAGFTLDSLGTDLLGAGKTIGFKELFSETYIETRSTWRTVKRCECGAVPCRMRQTTKGHLRIEEKVETVHERAAQRAVALESVVPGHPLWARAVAYSAQDAVLALGVFDLASRALRVERDVPWLAYQLPTKAEHALV